MVGTLVGVLVGTLVGVKVGILVGVLVAVGLGVSVLVGVGISGVGVLVGTFVGVGHAVPQAVTSVVVATVVWGTTLKIAHMTPRISPAFTKRRPNVCNRGMFGYLLGIRYQENRRQSEVRGRPNGASYWGRSLPIEPASLPQGPRFDTMSRFD